MECEWEWLVQLPGYFILFRLRFLFIFRERRREGEREGEKHRCARRTFIGCLSHIPSGELAWNPSVCPDWESNQWPFSSDRHSIHWATPARAPGYFKDEDTARIFLSASLCWTMKFQEQPETQRWSHSQWKANLMGRRGAFSLTSPTPSHCHPESLSRAGETWSVLFIALSLTPGTQ